MKSQRILLTVLLFTSGLCGISYEILYGRLLGNIIGDQFVVSTAVLLTFLLGIGLGALHAHRLWSRLWLIEAGIGLYAAIFALNLSGIESLLYTYVPNIGTSTLTSIVAVVVLLLAPAFAIGVSLPVFAGYVHQLKPSEGYFSSTYGIYNFAAALTVIFIEFWLIRETGIKIAVFVIGALNALVAIGLLALFRDVSSSAPVETPVSGAGFSRRVLIALAISSVASAIFQLTAIRLSELLFGPFRETFAYVLCIILLGIAIGSLVVNRFRIGFVPLLITNIISLGWALGSLSWVMTEFAGLYPTAIDSYWQLVALKFATIALVTLAPAITFGATIPALLNTLQGREGSPAAGDRAAARSPGYLLYIASIANAAGFLLMFLIFHQHLDYGELLLLVATLSGLSLFVIGAPKGLPGFRALGRWVLPFVVLIFLAGTATLSKTRWNEELLYQGHMAFHSPRALNARVGEHATSERYKGAQDVLSISRRNGELYFVINGKVSIRLEDTSEKIVGAIGGIFASDHRKALVLGVGSGATAGSVGLMFDEVEAVEISKVILDNLHRLTKYNFDLQNMSNMTLVHDDAIHAVKVADGDYSLILNTVTSPLFFSSSKLYTADFLGEVKAHLAPGGLYMTWLDSRVGDKGADIMVETVSQAFEHCGLAQLDTSYLLMLCSDTPIVAHHPLAVSQQAELNSYFSEENDIDPAGIAYQLLNTDLSSLRNPRGAPLNTLDKPVLAFEMARVATRGIKNLQARIEQGLILDNLAGAFQNFEWGFLAMLDALNKMDGNGFFFHAWRKQYVEFTNLFRQGIQAEQTGDLESAVDFFNRAFVIDRRWEFLNLRLGNNYEKLGMYAEALASYEKEEELRPDSSELKMVQGRTLLRLNRYQDAFSLFSQVPEKEHSGAYYYLLGWTMERMGDKPEADQFYAIAEQMEGSMEAAQRAAVRMTGEG